MQSSIPLCQGSWILMVRGRQLWKLTIGQLPQFTPMVWNEIFPVVIFVWGNITNEKVYESFVVFFWANAEFQDRYQVSLHVHCATCMLHGWVLKFTFAWPGWPLDTLRPPRVFPCWWCCRVFAMVLPSLPGAGICMLIVPKSPLHCYLFANFGCGNDNIGPPFLLEAVVMVSS